MESAWTTPEVRAVLALQLACPARNCGDAGTRCFEHNPARAAVTMPSSRPGMEELEEVLGVSLSY